MSLALQDYRMLLPSPIAPDRTWTHWVGSNAIHYEASRETNGTIFESSCEVVFGRLLGRCTSWLSFAAVPRFAASLSRIDAAARVRFPSGLSGRSDWSIKALCRMAHGVSEAVELLALSRGVDSLSFESASHA